VHYYDSYNPLLRNFYTEVALVTQELDIHTVKLCYNVLTPGVQFLEVVVETDLQSAIGGLSEEGRSNAGVCVCVGRGCKEESSCWAIIYTLQLISQKLKVTVGV